MNTRFLGIICIVGSVIAVLDAFRLSAQGKNYDDITPITVGLWCIGQVAPTPCPHRHSAACASAARIHNDTGTDATVPTWNSNQIAVSGASRRRRRVIRRPP